MFTAIALSTALISNPYAATVALVEHQVNHPYDDAYSLVESITLTDAPSEKASFLEMLEYLEASSVDY